MSFFIVLFDILVLNFVKNRIVVVKVDFGEIIEY